jgi:hypothetical protein
VIVMVRVLWTRAFPAPAASSIAFNVAAALGIGFSRSAYDRAFSAALFFLFHGDGDGTDCGEADLVAFYARDEAAINEVVMTLVASLAAVSFGQLDPIDLDLIDRSDMDTVRADYFHVFLDLGHWAISPAFSIFRRNA